jgi:hypothetical protein
MASIDGMTFDATSYNPGDTVTLTVNYTPDTPSAVPQTFNATSSITDSGGNVVATSSAPFVVNEAQAAGDVVSASDDGGRTWTEGSDSGSVAVFSATA